MNFVKSLFEPKKDDKSDKIFVKNVAISLIGMFICIVALCSSTWAWFKSDTTSECNTVTAGHFDLTVTVTDSTDAPVDITKSDATYVLEALGGETYTISLAVTSDSTVSGGYCILTIGGQRYRTTYITAGETLNFTIRSASNITVSLLPMWGTPSTVEISNGGNFTLE